jgi:tripartite ATP-independent transporter DctM subunit
VFTPTEAAAVAIVYIVPIGFLGYRTLNGKIFKETLQSSGRIVGAVFILVALVVLFGRILAGEQIPTQLADFVLSLSDNPYVILAMINIMLLLVGMLMDDLSGAIVMIPVLLPIVEGLGMNRIQLAAILATNLGIGLMTPPVAPNLFVGAMVGGVSISQFMRYVWPFLIFVGIPTVLLTTYVPGLSLWLPGLLLGAK